MSTLIFMGGFWAVLAGTDATACNPGDRALSANLASALFATIYAKLLIPRLGT